MPQQIEKDQNFHVQNEADLLGNGKNGSSSANAGALANLAKNLVWDGAAFQLLRQAVTGSITSLVGIINVINLARYNATQPTLADGEHRSLQINSKAELLVAPAALRGTLTDRAGTSSATQNVWTQVFPPNATRLRWEFQNPPDSGVLMELGFGAVDATVGATATRLIVLAPGDPYGESAPSQWVNVDRLSVRVPSGASKTYIANEA